MSILEERTHPHFEIATFPIYPGKVSHIPITSKVFLGTSSRPEVFLLGPLSTDLDNPKLALGNGLDKKEAVQKTVESLRKSWQHHFGIRVILGKEFETGEVDESREIISTDKMLWGW